MTVFGRWVERMERVGIGFLRLSAVEFGALTPLEFSWRLDAEFERENRALERLADLACWLINSRRQKGQKSLTKKDLIKRKVTAR